MKYKARENSNAAVKTISPCLPQLGTEKSGPTRRLALLLRRWSLRMRAPQVVKQLTGYVCLLRASVRGTSRTKGHAKSTHSGTQNGTQNGTQSDAQMGNQKEREFLIKYYIA